MRVFIPSMVLVWLYVVTQTTSQLQPEPAGRSEDVLSVLLSMDAAGGQSLDRAAAVARRDRRQCLHWSVSQSGHVSRHKQLS